MSEQKESSVLFNLKELMSLEEDRIETEEEEKTKQEEEARVAKEAEEQRVRDARVQLVRVDFIQPERVAIDQEAPVLERRHLRNVLGIQVRDP